MERTLPSVGSQLKCILQPVEKFVGKLTDVLKQRGKEKGGRMESWKFTPGLEGTRGSEEIQQFRNVMLT